MTSCRASRCSFCTFKWRTDVDGNIRLECPAVGVHATHRPENIITITNCDSNGIAMSGKYKSGKVISFTDDNRFMFLVKNDTSLVSARFIHEAHSSVPQNTSMQEASQTAPMETMDAVKSMDTIDTMDAVDTTDVVVADAPKPKRKRKPTIRKEPTLKDNLDAPDAPAESVDKEKVEGDWNWSAPLPWNEYDLMEFLMRYKWELCKNNGLWTHTVPPLLRIVGVQSHPRRVLGVFQHALGQEATLSLSIESMIGVPEYAPLLLKIERRHWCQTPGANGWCDLSSDLSDLPSDQSRSVQTGGLSTPM